LAARRTGTDTDRIVSQHLKKVFIAKSAAKIAALFVSGLDLQSALGEHGHNTEVKEFTLTAVPPMARQMMTPDRQPVAELIVPAEPIKNLIDVHRY
jgi:hypothetical protein